MCKVLILHRHMMLLYEINLDPIPQAHCVGKGHIYTPDHIKKYVEMIKWQLKPYAPSIPLTGRIEVDVTCYFKIPKSTSGIRKRQMLNDVIGHTNIPDEDNCSYVIKNAMKKLIYEDDRQITDFHGHKRWGESGKIIIKIIPIEEIAPTRGGQLDENVI